ncbi:DUF2442 domain-containing protein [Algoriphagus aquimarinus]|uniref:DUF2442 domain-containing protein n=1 Tax=Algoriphagus aquimarinus TaxID=237018 RepID=UPI0030DB4F7E|tara:strand:+ start:302676 stop:302954 length:279 start_codon:yes stop_codon:yes gene_type:complete
MKLTVDYSERQEDILTVESAKYLDEYRLEISFSDGRKKIVDFLPFLSKSSHPEIKKYLDLGLFRSFQIIEGNINWNDFDLIFPISCLRAAKL